MNTKKTQKITIHVSEEDINEDADRRRNYGDRCMLAEAFKRRLDLRPGQDSVHIGYGKWQVRGPKGTISGRFPPLTTKKIKEWDDGVKHDPFDINVTFPADWRQRLG